MISDHTLRLLILNDSEAEAERLISMLHNAGKNTRAQLVNAETIEALIQGQNWDLMIAQDSASDTDVCLQTIFRVNKDIPVILQSTDDDTQTVVEGMKRGAADVVVLDQDQHLLLVIDREINNRQQRQSRISADKKRREAEQRAHELLDSSRDGIAFIQDGLCLYVNASFAESFGYEDIEDVAYTPIIDLISETQQAEFKRTLQDFTLQGDEQGKRQEKIRANCADGSEVALKINLSHGRYEEEPCIELRIPSQDQDQDLALEMQKIKNRDPATELWNRQHLVDNINQLLASPAPQASVLLIEIDDFYEQVQNKVGLAASEDTLKQIAAVVQPCLDDTDILGRFADDAFMVLSQQTTVSAIEQTSQSILEKCANAIVEAGGRTAQFTVSIGIALINENSIDSDTIINQAAGALNDIRNSEENINQVKLYEPKQIGSGTSVDEIQEALSENRFRLLFQPVISLRGSSQEYYEVQLRMLDKSGDEVSPSNFLELAKSIGSGAKLDRWVILESMKALAKQRSRHPNTNLMITVSADSIRDRTLIAWVKRVLETARIKPDHVVFQISEKDANLNLNDTQSFLDEVAKLESTCLISNFGCSLNPTNTIEQMATELYKVDGSFALDIQNNNQSPDALLQLLNELHKAGKTTFITQIENASILSTLWSGGVHYIQGHYLQAPSTTMDYDFTMDG